MDAEDFTKSGMSELDKLSEWYWQAKLDCMNQEMSEWRKLYQYKINVKLLQPNTEEDFEALQNGRMQYTLSEFSNYIDDFWTMIDDSSVFGFARKSQEC